MAEKKIATIYPKGGHIFRAFEATTFSKVKVVILGQDPYHGPDQAEGLSFSVPFGVKPPPSLGNIYKELKADLGFQIPVHGLVARVGLQRDERDERIPHLLRAHAAQHGAGEMILGARLHLFLR